MFSAATSSEAKPTRPIRAELLAAKIDKIQNFEQPRLLEEFGQNPRLVSTLWFLQWVSHPSNYPGGLSKFAADLIDASTYRIGTKRMISPKSVGKESPKDEHEIFSERPHP